MVKQNNRNDAFIIDRTEKGRSGEIYQTVSSGAIKSSPIFLTQVYKSTLIFSVRWRNVGYKRFIHYPLPRQSSKANTCKKQLYRQQTCMISPTRKFLKLKTLLLQNISRILKKKICQYLPSFCSEFLIKELEKTKPKVKWCRQFTYIRPFDFLI